MKKQSGFTLTELMVVVIVVSVLAAIAIPSYRDSVRKGNRRAAQAVMMDIANRERQYFIANREFADHTSLNYALPEDVVGKYTFTITPDAGPPPAFTINFTAVGAQADDGDLSLTSDGEKGPDPEKW
jgi:type IV pilus assembly protein PilE